MTEINERLEWKEGDVTVAGESAPDLRPSVEEEPNSRRSRYIDKDTTDEFLDKPPIRYSDGSTPATGKALDERLDQAYRKAHGLGPPPELPEPTDH